MGGKINMDFRLVDKGWKQELSGAVREEHGEMRIICPFIKHEVAKALVQHGRPKLLQVITRFNLRDFANGVSDTSALALLLKSGAQIRGVKNLHAKLYLFGKSHAILTSANLTSAALSRNHEFGFVSKDKNVIDPCHDYFNDLWNRAGKNLQAERIAEWDKKLEHHLTTGARPKDQDGLGDEGADAGTFDPPPMITGGFVAEAGQAFVKFFGEGDNRLIHTEAILEEVDSAGCHWACTYPDGKRPRAPKDGAIMFMARTMKEPHDIVVFGRAVGMKHVEGRDDATKDDIERRSWKKFWPHYIRVHHAEFMAGSFENGVSLNALMDELGAYAFAPTKKNLKKGLGNTNPRRAYSQQAAVELSEEGLAWVREKLELAFEKYGKIPQEELDKLDWPEIEC
jgi:hypothetical protein